MRWAGGKQWLSGQLAKLVPESTCSYYEPFLGGGSLYFAALPKNAVLSDLNPRLVETYQTLRDGPNELINVLGRWVNDRETYYHVREATFSDSTHRAAQFIYLNRTCWNGLYRVNRQGKFNVPFGNHGRPVFDSNHLFQVSDALRDVVVSCGDFERMLAQAGKGDFVYLDPPYISLQSNGGSDNTMRVSSVGKINSGWVERPRSWRNEDAMWS